AVCRSRARRFWPRSSAAAALPSPKAAGTSRRRSGSIPMTQSTSAGFVEEVELAGHIIDSLLLPKVLDEIITHGGSYVLRDIRIGQRQTDTSFVKIAVQAPTAALLGEILDAI